MYSLRVIFVFQTVLTSVSLEVSEQKVNLFCFTFIFLSFAFRCVLLNKGSFKGYDTRNKQPVYYKSWSSKGTQNVRHLIKDADNFLSFSEVKERFKVKTNFFVYHGLVSCIKLLKNATANQNETFLENFIKAPIDWHIKSLSALNRGALEKTKRNGVPTASIGRWPLEILGTRRECFWLPFERTF